MQVFHTSLKKKKPKKLNAAQRQLQSDWEKLLKKYEPKKPVSGKVAPVEQRRYVRETPKVPSLPMTGEPCLKKQTQTYTGTAIKGIGTMHKSNSVPVFSDEEAIDLATMRRN